MRCSQAGSCYISYWDGFCVCCLQRFFEVPPVSSTPFTFKRASHQILLPASPNVSVSLVFIFPFSPSSLCEGCDFGHSTHSLGRFSSCLYIPKQSLVLVAARAPLCPSPSGTSQPSDSSDAEEPPCLEPSQPSLASAGACPAPRSHTGHFTVHEVKRILLFSSL